MNDAASDLSSAMAAGVTDRLWSVEELIEEVSAHDRPQSESA